MLRITVKESPAPCWSTQLKCFSRAIGGSSSWVLTAFPFVRHQLLQVFVRLSLERERVSSDSIDKQERNSSTARGDQRFKVFVLSWDAGKWWSSLHNKVCASVCVGECICVPASCASLPMSYLLGIFRLSEPCAGNLCYLSRTFRNGRIVMFSTLNCCSSTSLSFNRKLFEISLGML